MTEQSVTSALWRRCRFSLIIIPCFGCQKQSIYGGSGDRIVQDVHCATEGNELQPADVWIVVARDQVNEYVFQLLEVPLYELCALSKVVGISNYLGRLPVSQIVLQGLPQDS